MLADRFADRRVVGVVRRHRDSRAIDGFLGAGLAASHLDLSKKWLLRFVAVPTPAISRTLEVHPADLAVVHLLDVVGLN